MLEVAARYRSFIEVAQKRVGGATSTIEDRATTGREITIDGRRRLHFGNCSYLGLDQDERVKAGAIDAINRYGAVFSIARGHASLPLYDELEDLLGQLFGNPTLVSPTTTLAHMGMIPILVDKNDAVVLDQMVHTTVRNAAKLVKADGVHVETLSHGRLDLLQERIRDLSTRHSNIWYMVDGVYSIVGELAPMEAIKKLLEAWPNLYLYADDAHAAGWRGFHGKGHVLGALPHHPRMIVATSLAKGFGACGGAVVFPQEEMRGALRMCCDTMVFSGPATPATLGAAIETTHILLSQEVFTLQASLQERIDFFSKRSRELGLPICNHDPTPIFHLPVGSNEALMKMSQRVFEDGYYVGIIPYPGVPRSLAGLRNTITLHHSFEDIDGLLTTYARHYETFLQEEGLMREQHRKNVGLDPEAAR